jgi:hypothetical protein
MIEFCNMSRQLNRAVPMVMYSVRNPQDNFSELYLIYGEELATATDPEKRWVPMEMHGYWDEAELDPKQKFKLRSTTLAPNEEQHCLTIDDVFKAVDAQILFRAKTGFKSLFTTDFVRPPFQLRYEILPGGTRKELP